MPSLPPAAESVTIRSILPGRVATQKPQGAVRVRSGSFGFVRLAVTVSYQASQTGPNHASSRTVSPARGGIRYNPVNPVR